MKKNQHGFSAVEGLLIVVIVGLLGVVGWITYKNHHKTTTDTATTSTPEKTTTPATSTQTANHNVVKFAELGVQLTVPNTIKDLIYKYYDYPASGAVLHDDAGKPIASKQANMSTSSLLSSDANCTATASPVGILMRVDGTYPSDANSDNSGGTLVKQFSSFYIGYSSNSAGGCTAAQKAQDLQAVKDTLNTVQIIQ